MPGREGHNGWAQILRVEGKDRTQSPGALTDPEVQGHQQGSGKVTHEEKASNKRLLLNQLPWWVSET